MFNKTKTNKLTPNLVAKQLRLVPLEFKSGRRKHICLRMEVYGCPIDEQIGQFVFLFFIFLEPTNTSGVVCIGFFSRVSLREESSSPE